MANENINNQGGAQQIAQPQQPIAVAGSDDQQNTNDVATRKDGSEKREHTRSTMAILFVLGFFAILFLCFVYAIVVDATLGELKDALIGIAGALSGTLGFIVGFYYKSVLKQ